MLKISQKMIATDLNKLNYFEITLKATDVFLERMPPYLQTSLSSKSTCILKT